MKVFNTIMFFIVVIVYGLLFWVNGTIILISGLNTGLSVEELIYRNIGYHFIPIIWLIVYGWSKIPDKYNDRQFEIENQEKITSYQKNK
jgi:hypothetical protein